MSGSLITPYFLAALSPKALDRARPGPQLFFPGAHILLGPEYLSFPISSGCMTPPAASILFFSEGRSGLWSVESCTVVIPLVRMVLESPTLME